MALQWLRNFFGSDDDSNGVEELARLLRSRERSLSLYAVYGEPMVSYEGEPTAVFPADIYREEGQHYGTHAKEFIIPDNGLNGESPLAAFLEAYGIESVDALGNIEGERADAMLSYTGDIRVATDWDIAGDDGEDEDADEEGETNDADSETDN